MKFMLFLHFTQLKIQSEIGKKKISNKVQLKVKFLSFLWRQTQSEKSIYKNSVIHLATLRVKKNF